jgi:hypothetical protein
MINSALRRLIQASAARRVVNLSATTTGKRAASSDAIRSVTMGERRHRDRCQFGQGSPPKCAWSV